jgi:uncharacterized phage protein (TIGR01671 family)
MRTIKYRVYYPKLKEVTKGFTFKEAVDRKADDIFNKYNILMEYTGFKDINGKEIYEGDIVKTTTAGKYKEENKTSDVIRGIGGQWQVRAIDEKGEIIYKHGLPISWGGWDTIKVIGNIYTKGVKKDEK